MRRWLIVGLAAGLAAALLQGEARAQESALRPGGMAEVHAVVDGDTVILDRKIEGADEVRLVGIQAPKLALGRPGFADWPLAEAAKAALADLTLGRKVRLLFGGQRVDRHGRLLAHLVNDREAWVQGEMLARGMARVYTFPDNRAQASALYACERQARGRRRGIWGLAHYAVRSPESVARDTGTFQLVEGTVLDAANVKGTVYLNFGGDWRRDFTIVIDKPSLAGFSRAGFDPLALKGTAVRVRGWVSSRNGPMIEATHPEQIERGGDCDATKEPGACHDGCAGLPRMRE